MVLTDLTSLTLASGLMSAVSSSFKVTAAVSALSGLLSDSAISVVVSGFFSSSETATIGS